MTAAAVMNAPYEDEDFPMSPEMIEAAERRLEEIGTASSVYLAKEAFQAAVKIALRQGLLTLP